MLGKSFGEGVTLPLPSNDNAKEFSPVDPEGNSPGDKIGLNGLPSLDGIGRIRLPFDCIFGVSIGVLVEEPCLCLVARLRTGDSEDWVD